MTSGILPLRVRGLGYEAGGRRLLDGLDFDLAAGSRTVLLGPNGAGKSLTLRLCHGLLTPTRGHIDWSAPPERARRAQAMVFQKPVLLRRSARANLEFALACRGVKRGMRRALADKALAESGMTHLARSPARVLSAGEQQRLALARARALRPDILFLDEPTANLDPTATRAVEEAILAIDDAGTKIVLTTHDLGQARRIADEILFLHQGRLVEHGPATCFFEAPETKVARAFMDGRLPGGILAY